VTTKLKPARILELVLKSSELRHSVGIVYDERGSLFRTANIREDAAGFLVNTGQLNSINCRREIFSNGKNRCLITPDLKFCSRLLSYTGAGRTRNFLLLTEFL